jgi:hypothetical protein
MCLHAFHNLITVMQILLFLWGLKWRKNCI